MKIVLLILVLGTSIRAEGASVTPLQAQAVVAVPAIEKAARELRGMALDQFVPQRNQPRFNQGQSGDGDSLGSQVQTFEALSQADQATQISQTISDLNSVLSQPGNSVQVPTSVVLEVIVLLDAFGNHLDNDSSSSGTSEGTSQGAYSGSQASHSNQGGSGQSNQANGGTQQNQRRRQRVNRAWSYYHRSHRVYTRQASTVRHHHKLLQWGSSRHHTTYHNYHANNKRARRSQTVAYAGNAATFQDVPNLLALVSGAATIYNTIFAPLPQNGTNPPSGLQQAVYYLQLYATIRNFAISFTANRAGIENNLNQVLNNATALGFSKNEMLAFYGYLDLVNSLQLSTQAFTAPFIAQSQQLNVVLTNFTNTLKAIAQDINFLLAQNSAVDQATNSLTSNDPKVANPTMQDMEQIDAALLLIPNILTIYINIQNAITDLQAQLSNLQSIRTQIQVTISNMQLIVNGKGDQVVAPGTAEKMLATAILALVYSIVG